MTTDAPGSVVEPVPGAPVESESFPKQWGIVTATTLRNLIRCGRQAGKTCGIVKRKRNGLVRGRKVLYIGRIRRNVKIQFYRPVIEELIRAGAKDRVDFERNEADFILHHKSGGMLMAISADDASDIEKGRGFTWDDVTIDESQSHPDDVLEPLVDKILIPTLFKGGGSLNLAGTVPDPERGEAVHGYFVRLIRRFLKLGVASGWTEHRWTTLDNPHIPQKNVYEAYAARGIGPGHPIWEAEVMAELVNSDAARVFPYDPKKNGFTDADLEERDADGSKGAA